MVLPFICYVSFFFFLRQCAKSEFLDMNSSRIQDVVGVIWPNQQVLLLIRYVSFALEGWLEIISQGKVLQTSLYISKKYDFPSCKSVGSVGTV